MLMSELQTVLDQLAPPRMARMGDEPGWQGAPRDEVTQLGVCVDTTEENLRQAAELGLDALVAHHGWDGCLPQLVRDSGLAVYKCHTNWDRAPEGNSVVLARRLRLDNIEGFNYSAIGDCRPISAMDVISDAGKLVGRRVLTYVGDPRRTVKRIGIMAGACFGAGFEDEWAELIRRGAELVLSGDLSQRVGRMFAARGVVAVDFGHSSSELPGMEHLAELLRERLTIPVVVLRDVYGLSSAVV